MTVMTGKKGSEKSANQASPLEQICSDIASQRGGGKALAKLVNQLPNSLGNTKSEAIISITQAALGSNNASRIKDFVDNLDVTKLDENQLGLVFKAGIDAEEDSPASKGLERLADKVIKKFSSEDAYCEQKKLAYPFMSSKKFNALMKKKGTGTVGNLLGQDDSAVKESKIEGMQKKQNTQFRNFCVSKIRSGNLQDVSSSLGTLYTGTTPEEKKHSNDMKKSIAQELANQVVSQEKQLNEALQNFGMEARDSSSFEDLQVDLQKYYEKELGVTDSHEGSKEGVTAQASVAEQAPEGIPSLNIEDLAPIDPSSKGSADEVACRGVIDRIFNYQNSEWNLSDSEIALVMKNEKQIHEVLNEIESRIVLNSKDKDKDLDIAKDIFDRIQSKLGEETSKGLRAKITRLQNEVLIKKRKLK